MVYITKAKVRKASQIQHWYSTKMYLDLPFYAVIHFKFEPYNFLDFFLNRLVLYGHHLLALIQAKNTISMDKIICSWISGKRFTPKK